MLRGLGVVWGLLPPLAPLAVVATVFVLDPAAVARLAWSSTAGAFGPFVQVGVSTLLVLGAGMTAWAFWPRASVGDERPTAERVVAGRPSRPKSKASGSSPKNGVRKARAPGVATLDAAPLPEPAVDPAAAAAERVTQVAKHPAAAASRSNARIGTTRRGSGRSRRAGAPLAGADVSG